MANQSIWFDHVVVTFMIFVFSRWWKNHLDHCWRLDPIRSSKFTTFSSGYSLLICYKAFHKKNTDLDIWFDRSVVTFFHLFCFQLNSRWIEVLPIPLAVSISRKSSLSFSGIHYLYRVKLWIKKSDLISFFGHSVVTLFHLICFQVGVHVGGNVFNVFNSSVMRMILRFGDGRQADVEDP
jgi:hypothetical protein